MREGRQIGISFREPSFGLQRLRDRYASSIHRLQVSGCERPCTVVLVSREGLVARACA